MSAAQNPGAPQVASQPMAAQTAKAPVQLPQMPSQVAQATAPTVPTPQFGLDGIGVTQTSPAGFQPTGVPGVDDLLNQAPQQTNAAPTMALDLNDVLNGQIL